MENKKMENFVFFRCFFIYFGGFRRFWGDIIIIRLWESSLARIRKRLKKLIWARLRSCIRMRIPPIPRPARIFKKSKKRTKRYPIVRVKSNMTEVTSKNHRKFTFISSKFDNPQFFYRPKTQLFLPIFLVFPKFWNWVKFRFILMALKIAPAHLVVIVIMLLNYPKKKLQKNRTWKY